MSDNMKHQPRGKQTKQNRGTHESCYCYPLMITADITASRQACHTVVKLHQLPYCQAHKLNKGELNSLLGAVLELYVKRVYMTCVEQKAKYKRILLLNYFTVQTGGLLYHYL